MQAVPERVAPDADRGDQPDSGDPDRSTGPALGDGHDASASALKVRNVRRAMGSTNSRSTTRGKTSGPTSGSARLKSCSIATLRSAVARNDVPGHVHAPRRPANVLEADAQVICFIAFGPCPRTPRDWYVDGANRTHGVERCDDRHRLCVTERSRVDSAAATRATCEHRAPARIHATEVRPRGVQSASATVSASR